MVEGMVADLVARGEDLAHQRFAAGDVAALLEEGGAGAEADQRFEDRRGLGEARAVVEGERDGVGRSASSPPWFRPFADERARGRDAAERFFARADHGAAVEAPRRADGDER